MKSDTVFSRRFLMGAAGLWVALRSAFSQGMPTLRKVGVLAPSTAAKEEDILKPFFEQMKQLGWVEGQNIAYDRVYADNQHQALPKLATELLSRKPEVIYAPPAPAALAAQQATDTTPIVFGAVWDPVSTGLVASLPRPGGNITGITSLAESMAPKRIQLLREVIPKVRRIGWLLDSTDQESKNEYKAILPIATSQGLTILLAEASNASDIETAMLYLKSKKVEAIYVGLSSLLFNLQDVLMGLAANWPMPIFTSRSQFVDAGALFSYGASLQDGLRRSAYLVDKILKGAKPRDLPVEQATKFELVVNLRKAKQLGITLPKSFMLLAERVIQ